MARYRCTAKSALGSEELSPIHLRKLHSELQERYRSKERKKRQELASRLNRARSKLHTQRKAGREALKQITTQATTVALSNLESRGINQIEQECIELAFQVINRFLGDRLPQDEQYLSGMITEAFQHLRDDKLLKVVVHPEDIDNLKSQIPLFQSAQFEVEQSREIKRGKATLHTSQGLLKIDWENELEQVARRVLARHLENQEAHDACKTL